MGVHRRFLVCKEALARRGGLDQFILLEVTHILLMHTHTIRCTQQTHCTRTHSLLMLLQPPAPTHVAPHQSELKGTNCRAYKDQLEGFRLFDPKVRTIILSGQDQSLVLTVLYVSNSLDSGTGARAEGGARSVRPPRGLSHRHCLKGHFSKVNSRTNSSIHPLLILIKRIS